MPRPVSAASALTGGHDDKAVINEVERGEDFIKGRYEHALKDDGLPMTGPRDGPTRLRNHQGRPRRGQRDQALAELAGN
ncbi:hypothetical protein [Phenylobacterium sp.]|uniref:hypothetical protein n=1 Tax=Phenylobacterium sp. TaxID=1871053 RepID=UPI002734D5BB|nr:hypothetical protein [Phenylobacterium sp.]MDP3854511.1 hypothetical protein [Phenylobacterium sp.]